MRRRPAPLKDAPGLRQAFSRGREEGRSPGLVLGAPAGGLIRQRARRARPLGAAAVRHRGTAAFAVAARPEPAIGGIGGCPAAGLVATVPDAALDDLAL